MTQDPHYRIQDFTSRVPEPREIKRAVDIMERRLASRVEDRAVRLDDKAFQLRWAQAQANRNR